MSGSPRPTFNGPAHIPYEKVTRHIWGDRTSGEVIDWIYVSSHKIHQLVFGLPPGGSFRHSDAHRTIFAADEVFYVLEGTLVLSNPATGEVRRARTGEAIFFRRDTWHHGFNYGTAPLRVLEFFAPPPSQGTSSAYAGTKSYLTSPKYTQDQWLGRWPAAQCEAAAELSLKVLSEPDIYWRLEGLEDPVQVGILASTEHLTVGKMVLLPGQQSELHTHGGDESLYLVEGSLTVRLPDSGQQPWFELKPGDGFYFPQGTAHQYMNASGVLSVMLFGVAPRYLPG